MEKYFNGVILPENVTGVNVKTKNYSFSVATIDKVTGKVRPEIVQGSYDEIQCLMEITTGNFIVVHRVRNKWGDGHSGPWHWKENIPSFLNYTIL